MSHVNSTPKHEAAAAGSAAYRADFQTRNGPSCDLVARNLSPDGTAEWNSH
jgi:hypothetical protein